MSKNLNPYGNVDMESGVAGYIPGIPTGKMQVKDLADLVMEQAGKETEKQISDREIDWVSRNCDPDYVKRMNYRFKEQGARIRRRERIINKNTGYKKKESKSVMDIVDEGMELLDPSILKSDDCEKPEEKTKVVFLYGLIEFDPSPYRYDPNRSELYNRLQEEECDEAYREACLNQIDKIREVISNSRKNTFYYLVSKTKHPTNMFYQILNTYDNFKIITPKKARKIKAAMAYDALSTEEKRELERKEKEQREKDYIDRNFFYPYFLEKNHPKKYKKIYGKNGDKEILSKKEKQLLKFFKKNSKVRATGIKKDYDCKSKKLVAKMKKELKHCKSPSHMLTLMQDIKDFEAVHKEREERVQPFKIFKNPNKKLRKRNSWENKIDPDKRDIIESAVDYCLEKLIEDPFSPDRYKNNNIVTEHREFISQEERKKKEKKFKKQQKKDLEKYDKKMEKKYKKLMKKREKDREKKEWKPFSKKDMKLMGKRALKNFYDEHEDDEPVLKDGELILPPNKDLVLNKKYKKTLDKFKNKTYGKQGYTFEEMMNDEDIQDEIAEEETKKEKKRVEKLIESMSGDNYAEVSYDEALDAYLAYNGF